MPDGSSEIVSSAWSRALQAVLEAVQLRAGTVAVDLSTQEAVRNRFLDAAAREGVTGITLPPPPGPLMSSMPTCRCPGGLLSELIAQARNDAFDVLGNTVERDARLAFAYLRHQELEGQSFSLEYNHLDDNALNRAESGISPATQAATWQPLAEAARASGYGVVATAMERSFVALEAFVEDEIDKHRSRNERMQAQLPDVLGPGTSTSAALSSRNLDEHERELLGSLDVIRDVASKGGPLAQGVVVGMLALRLQVDGFAEDTRGRAERLLVVVPDYGPTDAAFTGLVKTIENVRNSIPQTLQALVIPSHVSDHAQTRFATIGQLELEAEMDAGLPPYLRRGASAPPSVVIMVTPDVDGWRRLASEAQVSVGGLRVAAPKFAAAEVFLTGAERNAISYGPNRDAIAEQVRGDFDHHQTSVLLPYAAAAVIEPALISTGELPVPGRGL